MRIRHVKNACATYDILPSPSIKFTNCVISSPSTSTSGTSACCCDVISTCFELFYDQHNQLFAATTKKPKQQSIKNGLTFARKVPIGMHHSHMQQWSTDKQNFAWLSKRQQQNNSNMLQRVSSKCKPLFQSQIKSYSTSKPHVWINKDTKVICQGITGKQVCSRIFVNNICRVPSIHNKPLNTAQRWLVVSIPKSPVLNILACPFLPLLPKYVLAYCLFIFC